MTGDYLLFWIVFTSALATETNEELTIFSSLLFCFPESDGKCFFPLSPSFHAEFPNGKDHPFFWAWNSLTIRTCHSRTTHNPA